MRSKGKDLMSVVEAHEKLFGKKVILESATKNIKESKQGTLITGTKSTKQSEKTVRTNDGIKLLNSSGKKSNKDEYAAGKPPTKEEIARVEKWATWSRQPHTPEEIRAEVLKDHRCVCFTYLCESSKVTGSFFDEFVVLSTCLLDETNYKNDYEDVKKLLFTKLQIGDYDRDIKEIIIENREGIQIVTLDDIADKIDWKAIGMFQRIDLYTAERYGKFLPWDIMTPRCGLSRLYIEANKQEYITRYAKLKKDDPVDESPLASLTEDDFDDDIELNEDYESDNEMDDFDDDISAGLNTEYE